MERWKSFLQNILGSEAHRGKPILLTSQLAGDELIETYMSKHSELQTTAEAIVMGNVGLLP